MRGVEFEFIIAVDFNVRHLAKKTVVILDEADNILLD